MVLVLWWGCGAVVSGLVLLRGFRRQFGAGLQAEYLSNNIPADYKVRRSLLCTVQFRRVY